MAYKVAGRIFAIPKKVYKIILLNVTEFLVGFIFSNVLINNSFAPFGIAFAANSGIAGVLGVLLGHIANGYDVYRYLIAAVVAYAAHQFLGPVLKLPYGISNFMFSLWGVLLAGIGGIFIYDYSLSENVFFVFSGVFSGIFAYVFCVTKSLLRKKNKASIKIRYLCFTVSASVLIIGIMSFGKIATGAAIILTIFTLCCMVRYCGFLYVCTTSMIFSFSICLYNNQMVYLAGVLLLGTILAGVMKELGRYAPILGFIMSNILVNIYYRGAFDVWLTLLYVVAGGLLYICMPKAAVENVFRFIAPFHKKKEVLVLKRKAGGAVSPSRGIRRLEIADKEDPVVQICGKCKKKMLCWVRNYDRTTDRIYELEANISNPNFVIPSDFAEDCIHTEDIMNIFRKQKYGKISGYDLDFVKASRSKSGEIHCGDTSGAFRSGDGRFVLSIADGMGCGTEAAHDSEYITNLMHTLMGRGFERKDVLTLINDSLRRINSDATLGLDIAVVDLLSGRCELIKADASPTFVLRGGNVFEIGDASLPVGILEDTDIPVRTCTLIDGDILIMVSDGFMNDGTKWIRECIFKQFCAQKDSLGIAVGLLDSAAKRDLCESDDISVIVAELRARTIAVGRKQKDA